MKLYCPDVFIHTAPIEGVERAIIWQQTFPDMCVHVEYIAFYVHALACAHVCISRHACVFIFGSVAAPDLLLLDEDYGPRRFPRSHSSYVDW